MAIEQLPRGSPVQALDANSIVRSGSICFFGLPLRMAGNGSKTLWLASLIITVPMCHEEKQKELGRAISMTRVEMYGKYIF